MTIEEAILAKVRALPPDKQHEVLDFAESLQAGESQTPTRPEIRTSSSDSTQPSNLRERYAQLRDEIVRAGIPLLDDEEIRREIRERRGIKPENET